MKAKTVNMTVFIHSNNIFKIICLIAAILMVLYCTHDFLKNDDLSEVSFAIFNEDEDSI